VMRPLAHAYPVSSSNIAVSDLVVCRLSFITPYAASDAAK